MTKSWKYKSSVHQLLLGVITGVCIHQSTSTTILSKWRSYNSSEPFHFTAEVVKSSLFHGVKTVFHLWHQCSKTWQHCQNDEIWALDLKTHNFIHKFQNTDTDTDAKLGTINYQIQQAEIRNGN